MAKLFLEDNDAYALIRRVGLGASEASVYLGVNLYTTVDQLIAEKRSTVITEEERAISKKEAVRKGKDLEDLILAKFEKQFGLQVEKPEPMFRIINHPQLTINYDGVTNVGDVLIPVEAKFVTTYGTKYYDQSKAITNLTDGTPKVCGGDGIVDHITQEAALYGIPPYYYTQVQQQMMGLNAPFCFLCALFDKGWSFKVFKIFKDEYTQQAIIKESEKIWLRVNSGR